MWGEKTIEAIAEYNKLYKDIWIIVGPDEKGMYHLKLKKKTPKEEVLET